MPFKSPPNPNLGQHFLIDRKVLAIMTRGVTNRNEITEIGAGSGILTEALAKKAKTVKAFEIDTRFEKSLRQLQKKYKNIKIIFGDATKTKFDKNVFIISNLPYHITEPFLNNIIHFKVSKMRLMVGDKFGRIAQTSDPKDPNFSELSLLCKSFFAVKEIAKVSKNSFNPKPRTDAVILEFIPKKVDPDKDRADFIGQRLIFSQKKGSKLKNFLMNALILSDKRLTKNQARQSVKKLDIAGEILEKSFAQLNNEEIRNLAQALEVNGKHN